MAVGRDKRGSDEHVVCVAGDAAFTCGVSYEALNNVAEQTRRFIVVLNDNEWSIAKNVGAIASYFNKIATHPTYAHLHEKSREVCRGDRRKVRAQPRAQSRGRGEKRDRAERHVRGSRPALLRPNRRARHRPAHKNFWSSSRRNTSRWLLHILTTKGKGYAPALEQPDKFHGLGKFEPKTGKTSSTATPTYSELFGKTLAKFADTNSKILAITGAMPTGTGLIHFAKRTQISISMSASPKNTPRFSPRGSRRKDSSPSSRSTPRSCSARTT